MKSSSVDIQFLYSYNTIDRKNDRMEKHLRPNNTNRPGKSTAASYRVTVGGVFCTVIVPAMIRIFECVFEQFGDIHIQIKVKSERGDLLC